MSEIFDRLTPEERKHLATFGSMLSRPISEDEEEIQRLLDACIDAREKGFLPPKKGEKGIKP